MTRPHHFCVSTRGFCAAGFFNFSTHLFCNFFQPISLIDFSQSKLSSFGIEFSSPSQTANCHKNLSSSFHLHPDCKLPKLVYHFLNIHSLSFFINRASKTKPRLKPNSKTKTHQSKPTNLRPDIVD